MKKIILSICTFSTIFFACNNGNTNKSNKEQTKTDTTNIICIDEHNAQNSLDWNGTYSNDHTTIILNKDMTYNRITSEGSTSGEFAWDTDGNIIALVGSNGSISLLKVEENRLTNGDDLILLKK